MNDRRFTEIKFIYRNLHLKFRGKDLPDFVQETSEKTKTVIALWLQGRLEALFFDGHENRVDLT